MLYSLVYFPIMDTLLCIETNVLTDKWEVLKEVTEDGEGVEKADKWEVLREVTEDGEGVEKAEEVTMTEGRERRDKKWNVNTEQSSCHNTQPWLMSNIPILFVIQHNKIQFGTGWRNLSNVSEIMKMR